VSDTNDLLRMLGSGVRPVAPSASTTKTAGQTAGAVEGTPFAELLEQAERGEISSNRRVSAASGSGIELSDAESTALSAAADRAEAAGIRTALVMLDDRSVVLDVANRSVTGKAEFTRGIMPGIDGVINLSTKSGAAAEPATILPLPRVPPSALTQLLGRESAAKGA